MIIPDTKYERLRHALVVLAKMSEQNLVDAIPAGDDSISVCAAMDDTDAWYDLIHLLDESVSAEIRNEILISIPTT